MQQEKSKAIERALWQYACTRAGIVGLIFPILAVLFGLHAGLDLYNPVSKLIESRAKPRAAAMVVPASDETKKESVIEWLINGARDQWSESKTGIWLIDIIFDDKTEGNKKWMERSHNNQSLLLLWLILTLGVTAILWSIFAIRYFRSGFVDPPPLFDNANFFVSRFLTGWPSTRTWVLILLGFSLLSLLIHSDASCYFIAAPLILATLITPETILNDELKLACRRLALIVGGLALLNLLPQVFAIAINDSHIIPSIIKILNAVVLLGVSVMLFLKLPSRYQLPTTKLRQALNIVLLCAGLAMVFVPISMLKLQYAIGVLVLVGVILPLAIAIRVWVFTTRRVDETLGQFAEKEIVDNIRRSEILEADGLYAIVRPYFSQPVIGETIADRKTNKDFTFGGWYSRLKIPSTFGSDYYAIRRTSLVQVPFGVQGDDYTARMGKLFRGMMASAETGNFINDLRSEIERPWCVKKVTRSLADIALTKCPWDNPDILIIYAEKDFLFTIPVSAGLTDKDGFSYEASVSVKISLNDDAKASLDHFANDAVSQDQEHGKVVRDLIEGSRLVVKSVYSAIVTALFDARNDISLLKNHRLKDEDLKIDEKIRSYFNIYLDGSVSLWSDEKEIIQELDRIKMGATGFWGDTETEVTKRAIAWKNDVLTSQNIEANLDYIEKWLGDIFDTAEARFAHICNQKDPATQRIFEEVKPQLQTRVHRCQAALRKHLAEARAALKSDSI